MVGVPALEKELNEISRGFDGRIGTCAGSVSSMACTKGCERFSLQSVVKLLVGAAVLDAVDHNGWRLEDQVTITKRDLSLSVQPIAALVGPAGYRTTIGDLVRRAMIQSDSAATDILIARLGGPSGVQRFLDRQKLGGLRVDRDERHLQTETMGLVWKPDFVDAAVLDREIAAVPAGVRERAYSA